MLFSLAVCFAPKIGLADCFPNPPSLVGWWSGDGNANDIAGTNNGILQGGATAGVAGMVASAFNFDGTNNFVQIADSVVLKPTNLTIEAWVRFSGLDSAGNATVGQQYIVFKQNTLGSNFEGYDLSKSRVAGNDFFVFRVSSSSGLGAVAIATNPITAGVWYHVAGVRGSNFIQVYVNGQIHAQTAVSFPQNYGTLPLYFGSSGQTFWDRKFRGTLDEVSLYNRALSPTEIASVYSAGASGKCKGVNITTQPQSQNAMIGSNVTFSVAATGFGSLGYRWRFNGTNVPGVTNSVLTLTNVQPANAGDYTAVVTNSLGAATSLVAVLTVSTPPFITNSPQGQTVVAGGNVNLTVGAGGTTPLSYQWRKGGTPLGGQTSSTLALISVTANDAGSYDVVVTNLIGAVTSTPPATLIVNVPAFITNTPSSQTVVVGANVNFSVGAGGTTPLRYQWRKGSLALTGQTNSSLALSSVATNDAGNYDVVVTNVAGSVTSTPPAVLTVNVPPVINVAPQSQTVVVSSSVNLSVNAEGTAPLSYQWRKDGTANGQTSSTLAFASVTTNDAGSYDVVVTNVAGIVTSTPPAILTVIVPPAITSAPQSQTVVVGANASFSVGATGTAPLRYQWRMSGVSIGGQTNNTLLLATTTTNDAGSYDVVVTNVAGIVTSAPPATLTVNVPPFITNAPQSQIVGTGANVSFSVGATGTAPLRYQWRKEATPLTDQTNATLTITSVVASNAGSYDVVVTNMAGSVTSSPPATLTVNTAPFITTAPQSQTVVVGANASFSVGAAGTVPLRYQWRKEATPLTDQTNATLTITNVVASNAGNYDVVVTNVAGSVTSTPPATLTVVLVSNVPPFITNAPQSQVVTLGANVTLTVGAGGSLPLSYQWRKEGSVLGGKTGSALTLSNVTTNDSGNYDVVITNVAGSVTSTMASLFVRLFVDPQLEKAVLCALTNQPGTLGIADLQSLTNLFVRNRGITNLSGIQFATNLTLLDLSANAIRDLAPLQGLVKLASLELDENRADISTLSPLSGLTNLGCLVLGRFYLSSYSPLAGLTNLTSLTIRKGAVVDVGFLQNLKRLSSLNLSENSVTNASGLAGLTNLSSLDLRWNNITNHSSVWSGPTNIQRLHLGGNPLTNAPSLQSLPQLTQLDLNGSGIKDLSPLAGLTNLTYLGLSRNPITNYSVLSGLTGVVNLELSGNSISNLTFLSGLSRLAYADLSYNGITDLSPLLGLTNLNSLVLAGNPLLNYLGLSALTSVSNLWLRNNSISNATFVSSLPWLRHLNLDDNRIEDLSPVVGLTNLTGLGLSHNATTNYSSVSGLTNLTSLRLDGNSISNSGFLSGLTKLAFLSLEQNRIVDGTPLSALTNLQSLYLTQNRIQNISFLQSLPRLYEADVSLNVLNPTNGSAELSVIDGLHCQDTGVLLCACAVSTNVPLGRGVNVRYQPQHQNPKITAPGMWFISTNTASSLEFNVAYDVSPSDPLPVTGDSSNPGLIPNSNLVFRGTNNNRTLTVTAATNQTGAATLTLTVMNEAGLSNVATVFLHVLIPVSVTNMLPPGIALLDPGFEAAVRQALRKYDGGLTSVDLLSLTSLNVQNGNLANFTGWQWLTNLTSLSVSGSSVSNLTFLTNLTQLTFLNVYNTSVTDFGPLSALTNLTSLYLTGTSVSNVVFLQPLTQLKYLGVTGARVADISPLAGLTNLNYVDLQHNRIANIQTLMSLPALSFADLRMNLLDTSGGSVAMAMILNLKTRAIDVSYLPQRSPPVIQITTNWNISANTSSMLFFNISENGQAVSELVAVGAVSSNGGLIPDSNLLVGQDFTNNRPTDWILFVSPSAGQSGATVITLSVTNDVGLVSSKPITVVVSEPIPLDGNFFGLPDLSWQTSGNAPWFGQTNVNYQGFPAAQSGSIANSAQSTLEGGVIGPGTLSFWWKVSSETNYDWLVFESATVTNRISGEIDWQQQVVQVRPGIQTLRWRYEKDKSVAVGNDAAWVAHVTFVPATWLAYVSGPTNGSVRLDLYGVPGQYYEIQISTNLVNWTALGTLGSTNRIIPFTDASATNSIRFYRAKAIISPPLLIQSGVTNAGFKLSWVGIVAL